MKREWLVIIGFLLVLLVVALVIDSGIFHPGAGSPTVDRFGPT